MDNRNIQESIRNHFLINIRKYNQSFVVQSQGSSMLPLIRPGSELTIKGCSIENLNIGDLVAFRDKDSVSVHRCIFYNKKVFYERGDNCSLWVILTPKAKENLIGKVVSIKRDDGSILNIEHKDQYNTYSKIMVKIGILSAIVGKLLKNDSNDMEHKEISKTDFFSRLVYKKIHKSFNLLEKFSNK